MPQVEGDGNYLVAKVFWRVDNKLRNAQTASKECPDSCREDPQKSLIAVAQTGSDLDLWIFLLEDGSWVT
jgi:hypothetical protein